MKKEFYTSFWRLPLLLCLGTFLTDQLSKWLVLRGWPQPGIHLEVVPGFFSLVHFQNKGAAWGILASHTWMLGLLSLAALVAIVIFFRHLTENRPLYALLYGILAGGVAGNMFDRFYHTFVVDFLFFYLGSYERSWPAFNVADSAITCSVTALVIHSWFLAGRANAQTKTEKPSA